MLQDAFQERVAEHPEAIAIEDGNRRITYAELNRVSDDVAARLRAAGIGSGDRVSVCVAKSVEAVAAFLGTLKTGAAYVPVDPSAPLPRNTTIMANCGVDAVMATRDYADRLQDSGHLVPGIKFLDPISVGIRDNSEETVDSTTATLTRTPEASELAFVLNTSGSTGTPKGVAISHRAATSFVEWALDFVKPTRADRFSSHASFLFDLSVLDIYVSLGSGATLVLVPDELGKEPRGLARWISENRISVWYSVPSILSLLVEYGSMPDLDFSALHTVLFAGEVFPTASLKALMDLLPNSRLANLYGPTETNVCTYYEVPRPLAIDDSQTIPIGSVCEHLTADLFGADGLPLEAGSEGELCISGPSLLTCYWNDPEKTARSMFVDSAGHRWYRTGDLAIEEPPGVYQLRGRIDRMVKRRGYRIELGEIEAAMNAYDGVREAAAIADKTDDGTRITVHLATDKGERLSTIRLKQFCSSRLPRFMIPDSFAFCVQLPRTPTGKIDYVALADRAN